MRWSRHGEVLTTGAAFMPSGRLPIASPAMGGAPSSVRRAHLRATGALLLSAVAARAQSLQSPRPEEWPMAARDYANTRFSPLPDITRENVSKLKVAWTFDTGIAKG